MLNNDWPTLDVLRLRYIAQVIERNGGNKTRAADMLGIDRRTLNRILARERAKKAAAARNYRPLQAVPTAAPQASPAVAPPGDDGAPPGRSRALPQTPASPAPLRATGGRG
jgi:hypothetical protein